MISIQPLSPHILAQRMTHPAERRRVARVPCSRSRGRGPGCGGLQFISDVFQVKVEVVGDELANFSVFVVTVERPGVFCGGGVDVDVDACFVS